MRFRVLCNGVKYKIQILTGRGWTDYRENIAGVFTKNYFPDYKSAVSHIRKKIGNLAEIEQPYSIVSGPAVHEIANQLESLGAIQDLINNLNVAETDALIRDVCTLQGSLAEIRAEIDLLKECVVK